ncbi:MAG: indole-3-glycerol phosphate synthase TrpC [Bacteroidales bacterium]|nr:indole-3-glycerol phosphate synthase TrpC [Bacteroidales bacterium]
MNKLQEIVIEKRKQVEEDKLLVPLELLEQSIYFHRECASLKEYITRKDKSGIIAEIKKKSPALGAINAEIKVEDLAKAYEQAVVSAISVLTDAKFFGGCNADLIAARENTICPILRKDFVIDKYQIVEAKSIGADIILLIAAILTKEEIAQFTELAHKLGMEVILEVHASHELEKVYKNVDVIGVNNRNLETMQIDIATSKSMSKLIPAGFIKISESGIENPEIVLELKQYGYDGFLIGSHFMKHTDPGKACEEFIEQINKQKK